MGAPIVMTLSNPNHFSRILPPNTIVRLISHPLNFSLWVLNFHTHEALGDFKIISKS
jgi:hypothetical protein